MVWITWSTSDRIPLGVDSHAYWAAWIGDSMYDRAPGTLDAYLYSPAFAQAVWPLVQLPWPVFGVLWALATVAGLVYLFAPMGWRWVPPLLLLCSPEIASGNVFWLLALGWRLIFCIRRCGLLPCSPRKDLCAGADLVCGASGAAQACRIGKSHRYRDRRSCARPPDLWSECSHSWWIAQDRVTLVSAPPSSRLSSSGFRSLLVLLVATALMNIRWGLPVAMVWATPASGIAAFTILAALPRLLLAERSASSASSPDHSPRRTCPDSTPAPSRATSDASPRSVVTTMTTRPRGSAATSCRITSSAITPSGLNTTRTPREAGTTVRAVDRPRRRRASSRHQTGRPLARGRPPAGCAGPPGRRWATRPS